jgi:hypothetical protein
MEVSVVSEKVVGRGRFPEKIRIGLYELVVFRSRIKQTGL